VREPPLVQRKAKLQRLVLSAGADWLRCSENFTDGIKLLAASEHMGLEGVVSKRRDAPYRSGKRSDWIKVKVPAWRAGNQERWRLFEGRW
jgi:bifunctional non-homologous end joining protein LigD